MKFIQPTLLFLLLIAWGTQVEAQQIVRSTFCGTGGTFNNGTTQLRTTFGQCPGCGTLNSENNKIYAGFQQPVTTTNIGGGGTGIPCFASDFVVEVLAGDCGSVYNFEYTGTADPATADFNWDFGQDAFPQTSLLANPESIAYTTTGPKTIELTVSQDTCNDVVRMVINVTATAFGVDYEIIQPDCAEDVNGEIDLAYGGGVPPFEVIWADGESGDRRRNLAPGQYAFTVTDSEGCDFTNTAVIQAPDSIIIAAEVVTSSDINATDGSIDLAINGGTPPFTFVWDDGSTSEDRIDLAFDSYTVTVTDDNGCSNNRTFDFQTITDPAGEGLTGSAEEIFTPNFDNVNDAWVIDDIEKYPNNEVFVYNRWGQIVYSVQGYNNDWMGTNNDGEELQTGAYWYVVKFNDENDFQFSGVVTLVR